MKRERIKMIKKAFEIFKKAFFMSGIKLQLLDEMGEVVLDGQTVHYWGRTYLSNNTIELVIGVDRNDADYVGTLFHEFLHVLLYDIGLPLALHHSVIYPLHHALVELMEGGEWTIPDTLLPSEFEPGKDIISRGFERLDLPEDFIEFYQDLLELTTLMIDKE